MAVPTFPPLIEGPRWYRSRLRQFGPVKGLLPPAVLGAAALALLWGSNSTWRGAAGAAAGVFAAPGLLVVGAPFSDRSSYPLGIALSAVLWLLVGIVASRRATRNPVAMWHEFWSQYRWLLAGVWLGVAGGLIVARISIGNAIF